MQLTWLAEHVGKAGVLADLKVHLHPQRHRVQVTLLVKLIQENLRTRKRNKSIQGREGHQIINHANK
jgi:hypothetical protein